MDNLISISYWLVGIIILYWIINIIILRHVLKTRKLLVPRTIPELDLNQNWPKLTVLVAAKDEEENIEACVLSMLDQDYPNYEFIVVDDRSSDRTPEILQRLEENSHGRLKVIRIEELKDGWFGKNNAMREGVEQSFGDWFCFIDADCWQVSRQTLSVTMQEALSNQTDFLSVTPFLTMDKTWEKVVQPSCVLTLLSWYPPDIVNNPEKSTAYASGQFMMMSRNCYDTIGGHHRVKNEMNEDVLLAKHTKEAGLVLRIEDNDGLYRTRMYANALDAWKGWSRIYCGCIRSVDRLLLSLIMVTIFSVLPWVCLIATIVGRVYSGNPDQWNQLLMLWGGAAFALFFYCWRYSACFEMHKLWSITFPLGSVFTIAALVNAILKHLGLANTTWRGTTYSLDQRVESKAS